jgi:hypothetical protein
MQSRYDYMEAGNVCDIDGEEFPDCLTTVYPGFKITEVPLPDVVAEADINKFWLYMYRRYGVPYYDDIYLNINQIPYVGMLEPGSTLFNLKLSDMVSFEKLPEED